MTKTVLVTGAKGFIGKNLVVALKRRDDHQVIEHDIEDRADDLRGKLVRADVVFHLAGVNRPQDPEEYRVGNTELAQLVCDELKNAGKKATVVLSSTIQAILDNPYGVSKKAAEDAIFAYGDTTGASIHVFRLPNVFGKWGRPNYNSAVNTFCHNLARGLPIQVNDPAHKMDLVYVDDVVRAFMDVLHQEDCQGNEKFTTVDPVFQTTLGAIVNLLTSFAQSRSNLMLPDMNDALTMRLFATYTSYLPQDSFAYGLTRREDDRGALAEVVKSPHFGQLFFSTTKPGITRGNHYHDRKVEKFVVVSGEAMIRFEHILSGDQIELPVSGQDMKVVDIPPGYTHHIENVGETEMVVLFWANEMFDQNTPDTYFQEVRRD